MKTEKNSTGEVCSNLPRLFKKTKVMFTVLLLFAGGDVDITVFSVPSESKLLSNQPPLL